MNNHFFHSLVLHSILTILFVLISIPSSYGDNHEQFDACRQPNPCGRDIEYIWYPFWGKDIRPQYCGLKEFELECKDNQYPTIQFGDQSFRVLSINTPQQKMTIVRETRYVLPCRPSLLKDTIINQNLFSYSPNVKILTLFYNCSGELWPQGPNNLSCPIDNGDEIIGFYNQNLFSYSPNVKILTLFYNCSGELWPQGPNNLSCPIDNGDEIIGFYTIEGDSSLQNLSKSCNKVIKTPVQMIDFPLPHDSLLAGRAIEALNRGFEVEYRTDNISCMRCLNSSGLCGSNHSDPEQFACLCPDEPHMNTCNNANPGNRSKLRLMLVIGNVTTTVFYTFFFLCFSFDMGFGRTSYFFPHLIHHFFTCLWTALTTEIGTTTACIVICIVRSKKSTSILSTNCCRKITESDQDLEAFIRNYGPLAPQRYNYSDVKKMTNSFKDKLGQGGYGSVFKGKLSDGGLVAVKLLNISKGNGQEFINEVASISRTSHVNVVTLLGFCFKGSKRALIYEFMPNGSLDKFIINGDASNTSQHLGWEKMYEIVKGIARGLEYLHRGCNTRILHFDIKPHNILLDKDFCPKISDFGLAKLCLNKESIVSMLEARGTIGYIAPEVFSRNFGEVSPKSDVYSYGMMILELVGCKNNHDDGVDHSSEIYFPHWIYRHIEQGKEFKLPGVVTSEENETVKKMIIVGLWCIQTRPSDRPSMNKVIEMLQANTEALQIPSMPFLSSPPRPPIDSSIISMDDLHE